MVRFVSFRSPYHSIIVLSYPTTVHLRLRKCEWIKINRVYKTIRLIFIGGMKQFSVYGLSSKNTHHEKRKTKQTTSSLFFLHLLFFLRVTSFLILFLYCLNDKCTYSTEHNNSNNNKKSKKRKRKKSVEFRIGW